MSYTAEELPKIIEGLAYEMRFAQTLIDRIGVTIRDHQALYAESYENSQKSEYYRGMLVAFNAVRNDYKAYLAKTKAHFDEVTGAHLQNKTLPASD